MNSWSWEYAPLLFLINNTSSRPCKLAETYHLKARVWGCRGVGGGLGQGPGAPRSFKSQKGSKIQRYVGQGSAARAGPGVPRGGEEMVGLAGTCGFPYCFL